MNDETKTELRNILELYPLNEPKMQAHVIGRILLQATIELSRIADALQVDKDDFDPRFK